MDISGFSIGSSDFYYLRGESQRKNIDSQFAVKGKDSEKKAPYHYLADESGTITYKGVAFICDDQNQALCLGDMSDKKNVLKIPLSEGGCLMVNRNQLGELSRAISMFSAEDVGIIMRAIWQDTHCARKQSEIEEMEMEIPGSETEISGKESDATKEMPDEDTTKTEIVVRPDGSKVLMMTVTVGGRETVTCVELAKPVDGGIPEKNPGIGTDVYNVLGKQEENDD